MDTEIEVRKMECKEIRVDVRTASIKESTEGQRQTKILFQINHTMPFTDEYNDLLKELFENNLGDGSMISPPLNGACVGSVKIGRNVFINSNLLAMARGGITIEDNAELKIRGIENLVCLEAKMANMEGTASVTIRDLIKSALRMRPDRIIVGEVRGGEAVDMLQSFICTI